MALISKESIGLTKDNTQEIKLENNKHTLIHFNNESMYFEPNLFIRVIENYRDSLKEIELKN